MLRHVVGLYSVALCAASLVTVNVQNGASYSGGQSIAISTYNGLGNVGQYADNGLTFADDHHWCLGNGIPNGGNTYDQRVLIRFSNLNNVAGIPAGAKLVQANLTVYGHAGGQTGVYVTVKYVNKSWNQNVPLTCAGCGNADIVLGWRWYNRTSTASSLVGSWDAVGATGPTDTVPGLTSRQAGDIPTSACSDGSSTALVMPVDVPSVQRWVHGCENNGFILVNGVQGIHVGVVPNQLSASPSQRPQLTLVFDTAQTSTPDCTITGPSPVVQPPSKDGAVAVTLPVVALLSWLFI